MGLIVWIHNNAHMRWYICLYIGHTHIDNASEAERGRPSQATHLRIVGAKVSLTILDALRPSCQIYFLLGGDLRLS